MPEISELMPDSVGLCMRTYWRYLHLKISLASLLVGLALPVMVYGQAGGPLVSPEYKQYRTLADYNFAEGNYPKALALYKACLQTPRFENDSHARKQSELCRRVVAAQQQLEKALAGTGNLNEAVAGLKQLITQNSGNQLGAERLANQIDADGNRQLQLGNFERAMTRFVLAYAVKPSNNLIFKVEQVNRRYFEANKKPLPQYIVFQEKLNVGRSASGSGVSLSEYTILRQKGDASMQKGNYAVAKLKYAAALEIPGHEKDAYILEKIAEATTLASQPLTTSQLRERLATNPADEHVKQLLSGLLEKEGDALMQKNYFADARTRFTDALSLGDRAELRAKISDANQKIDASRTVALPTRKAQDTQQKSNRKPQSAIIGLGVVAGSSYAIPSLANQDGPVASRSGLQPYGGVQVLVLPDGPVSVVTGIQWAPGGFLTVNKTGSKLESFRYALVQIPMSLRIRVQTSTPSGARLVARGGILVSRPVQFTYTNYAADIATDDLTMLTHTAYGVTVGLGVDWPLRRHNSFGIMATYQHTGNLLNATFADKATNRQAATAAVQGWGLEFVFRFF